MALVINTNMASLNAQRNLSSSQEKLGDSLRKLSSGVGIDSKSNAAGMAIISRMDSQIRGLNQAARNAQDGISLAQTAEGALGSIQDNMARMRELAVQAANATSATDIGTIDDEFMQLSEENARIINSTSFNNIKLLNGPLNQMFQIGANAGEQIAITTNSPISTTAATLGPNPQSAAQQLSLLDTDLATVSATRAKFGALQSRFESVINNVKISAENQTAAKSRIEDADYAQETAKLTKNQILQQAGTAMLSQANQVPNGVLALLR